MKNVEEVALGSVTFSSQVCILLFSVLGTNSKKKKVCPVMVDFVSIFQCQRLKKKSFCPVMVDFICPMSPFNCSVEYPETWLYRIFMAMSEF